ncbi:hypothetical protein E2I00_015806, partial [Balaenoptera physalus]
MAPGGDTWVGSDRTAAAVAQAAGGGPGTRTCPQLPPSPPPPPPEEEHGERLVELHASFRELVTFFCTNAAIHGTIRLVCSSQNRLKTASWALLLAGALGLLCWQFGLLFERYWRYPAIVTVSIHSERSTAQALPVGHPCGRPGGRGPEPTLQLDHGIRLQRLSPLWCQNRVGCKLVSVPALGGLHGTRQRNSTGGDCIQQAYFSGVAAAREWYRFHCANALALPPAAHEDSHHSCGRRFVFSCRYDDQDRQARDKAAVVPSLQPRGCTQQGDGSGACAGLSVAPGSRRFQTPHHSSYGSCYTFNGVWAAQHPGLTHAECQPWPGHCFHRLCKDLETHRLPCASRCPWPCRGVGSAGSRKRGEGWACSGASWAESPPRTDLCPRGPALTLPRSARGGAAATVSLVCAGQARPPEPEPQVTSWPLPLPSSPSSTPREGPTSRSRALPLSPAPRRRSNLAKVNIFYQELSYRTVDEDTRLLREPPGLAAGVGQGRRPGTRCSPPADTHRCRSCFQPRAASGACVVEVLELLLDAAALALLLPAGGRVAAGMTLNARGPSSTPHDVAGALAGVLAGGQP